MLRKAILIGDDYASAATNGSLPGATKDVADLADFLGSPFGGAWSEIDCYPAPDRRHILETLKEEKSKYDYLFVGVIGHGARHQTWGSVVALNDNKEYIGISEIAHLGPRARRILVLSGACRLAVPSDPQLKGVGGDGDLTEGLAGAPNMAYVAACREGFDRMIARTPEGVTVMHSCGMNEEAWYREGRGGFFTQALLDGARKWATTRPRGPRQLAVRAIGESFEAAREVTTQQVWRTQARVQVPELLPSPCPNFPFAIA